MLFLEYAGVTKGKSAMQWTPGLRERLGVEDLEGNVLLDEQEHDEMLLAQFSRDQWRVVLEHDAAGRILDLAARGDDERVWRFLDGLRDESDRKKMGYPSPMTY